MEIVSAARAYDVLKRKLTAEVEEFWALGLTPGLKLICCEMIFRGTVDSCQVHPRDIFRFAYRHNASRLLLAHNHPSNDPEPSPSDLSVTNRLIEIGLLMEVPIIDHLIVVENGYRSMAENRDCDFKRRARSLK